MARKVGFAAAVTLAGVVGVTVAAMASLAERVLGWPHSSPLARHAPLDVGYGGPW